MTKDIETVILPKCEKCKEVIQNPHEGFIVVGDIYTAELGSDGEPHNGLMGASFPSVDDCPIGANGAMFTYDQVQRHCYCQTCMMDILQIPHRPIRSPVDMDVERLRGGFREDGQCEQPMSEDQ